MKTDLFQSCGHCWVFQICWHIECSTFTASSFRIWNNSTRIPSPPLALFIVMLSKAHLTSHSRMSGSRWVITPSWLSGLWTSFLYSSSVYSCHLFLISSAFVRSKEIQPIHSERDQPWDFFGRNDAKAETPVLWPPHVMSWFIGKDSDAGRDWGQEEKGMTEDEMAGWHHWLDGREFEWTGLNWTGTFVPLLKPLVRQMQKGI